MGVQQSISWKVLAFRTSSVNGRRSNGSWILNVLSFACFLLLLITSYLPLTECRPVHNGHRHGKHGIYEGVSEDLQVDGTTYLMKYGYLPGSDLETGALRTDEELHRAVRHFQKFAHIPETGRLDAQTIEAMKRPRCGMADLILGPGHHHRAEDGVGPPSGYTLGPSKWQKKWLTVRILNFTPDLNYQQTRDALIRALYVWSDVAQLSFHEVQTGYADIYIQFSSGYHQDGYPFDGPGMVLAHAFFPGDDKGGDIHFDEDETWTVRSENGVNLFMVAAHELGHSLGLAHSNVPGSLMFPWHQGYTADFRLHPDDITAIQYLYGAKLPPHQPPVPTIPPRQPAYPTHRPHQYPPTQPPVPTSTQRSTTTTPYQRTPFRITPPSTRPTTSTAARTTTSSVPTQRARVSDRDRVPGRPSYEGPSTIPDPCYSVDALSIIRGELFLFSGKWFWRINDHGVVDGFPVEISRFWYGIPPDLEKIDALFERSSDGRIIFFSGNKYWEFHGNHLVSDVPVGGKPISDFGLPNDVDHIDASFVWGHNRRTYIVVKDMYWKLNDTARGVELYTYPRDMSMWNGVKLPVDTAFTHTDGHTYFFKGHEYWQFNNALMHVRHGYPKQIGEKWLKCKPRNLPLDPPVPTAETETTLPASSSSRLISSYIFITALVAFLTVVTSDVAM